MKNEVTSSGGPATAQLWVRQSRAFGRRYLREVFRNRILLFLMVCWPILWYGLTLTLFIDEPAAFVKTGMGITFGLFGAFTIVVAVFAGGFAQDVDRDRYQKLRTVPVMPTADLTGRLGAGIVIGFVSYAATLAFAFATGATFEGFDLWTVAVIGVTLFAFCCIAAVIALLLAIVITKPEYMTMIAVVTVLLAFYMTGQNGLVPTMIVGDASLVNIAPNSLATRLQIVAWVGADSAAFLTPPEAPAAAKYPLILMGYAAGLLALSVGIVRTTAYKGD